MASLKKDIKNSSTLLVRTFKIMGKNLDYSVQSVAEIEKIINEDIIDGIPRPKGLFSEHLGFKLFAISAYIGEVVIRNTKATKWVTDDSDVAGELTIHLKSANGAVMFPSERVLHRVQNGEEDNLLYYTAFAVNEIMKFEGDVPDDFFDEELPSKPWWRFW